MNAIGGFVPATGRVELLGEDVSERPARRRGPASGSVARSRPPRSSPSSPCGSRSRWRSRPGAGRASWPRCCSRPRPGPGSGPSARDAAELIDFLGLGRYAERPIIELSTGTRRIVELAGLLALDARLLCLDEPTAGIAQRESEAMAPLLVQVRRELDAAMLIIEHDMPLIMGMSDRVYCLEAGRVIASGDPRSVRDDPAVIASYLGTDERTIQRSGAVASAPSTNGVGLPVDTTTSSTSP